MKKIHLQLLQDAATDRPQGYIDHVISKGTLSNGVLSLTREAYAALCNIYNGPHDPTTRPKYKEVTQAIQDAPDRGTWPSLKEEHRLTERAIAQNPDKPPCWRNRQRARLITSYIIATRKAAISPSRKKTPPQDPAHGPTPPPRRS